MYQVLLDEGARNDIQRGIDFYNSKKKGLGKKFYKEVSEHLYSLSSFANYQVRYDQFRCLPLKKFPVMIHILLWIR